jgi:predicted Zn finger-like uncharacterized protein
VRFACDRCKTRYSIADERVRGKILKIRCKSCANVITVKEGMDAAPPEGERAGGPPERPERSERSASERADRGDKNGADTSAPVTPARNDLSSRAYRPTTMAPQSTVGSGGVTPVTPAPRPAPALGAAFASAMASPQAPPQLEDEWYVSRDGEQHGPFGLPDAQSWISQQPYDAELHCWCEGFDDWLPVDRIAHFRSLRSRPAPPGAPPSGPLPRPIAQAGAPASSAAPQPRSDRPLSGPLPLLGHTPTRPTGASPPSSASPSSASPSSASLSGLSSVPAGAPTEDKPQFAATMAALAGDAAAALAAPPAASPPPSSARSSGLDGRSSSSAPARGAFDAGDLGSQGFATAGPGRPAASSSRPPGPGASGPLPGTDEDDLEFGEVSRVVRIADIGKTVRPQARAAAAAVRRTGANDVLPPSGAVSLPGWGPPSASTSTAATASPAAASATHATYRTGALPSIAPGTGSNGVGSPASLLAGQPGTGVVSASLAGPDSVRVEVPLVIPAKQRRNHALLLGLVAVGLIGAGVAALFLLQRPETEDSSMISLSGVDVSDLTIRPDDPRRVPGTGSAAVPPATGTGTTGRPVTGQTGIKRPGTPATGGAIPTGPGPGPGPGVGSGGKVETAPPIVASTPLGGDEVEEMSQKNSTGLQRCYELALKKDIFLEVKSIKVTISIDTGGVVTNVAMSSHSDHTLGQCMITRIRNWRFRPNSRGLDAKFTVAFGRT